MGLIALGLELWAKIAGYRAQGSDSPVRSCVKIKRRQK